MTRQSFLKLLGGLPSLAAIPLLGVIEGSVGDIKLEDDPSAIYTEYTEEWIMNYCGRAGLTYVEAMGFVEYVKERRGGKLEIRNYILEGLRDKRREHD